MHHIILSSVACLALSYFTTLSYERHDFRKNIIEYKRVFIFPTNLSETILNLRRTQRGPRSYPQFVMYSTYHTCQILIKVSRDFRNILKYQI